MPFARDPGLRLIIARSTPGAGRAVFEPVIQRTVELGKQGLPLSGDGAEGPLIGTHRAVRPPPGRARFVTRRRGAEPVRTAWIPPG
ncbi:hypothetical protein [Streptomyces sp. YGL11-2]|uniref:hypothetical protein n=1 Tax=Streptomyces sp. YGL11-2 TaxID=3414028 RepID=UPI003CF2629F